MGGVGPGQPCLLHLRSLAGARVFALLSGDPKVSALLRNWLKSSQHWWEPSSAPPSPGTAGNGGKLLNRKAQKQKQAQGIFKPLTDRSKPKFITSSLFNVAFFFSHLSFKETLLFYFFLSLSSDSNSPALTNRTSSHLWELRAVSSSSQKPHLPSLQATEATISACHLCSSNRQTEVKGSWVGKRRRNLSMLASVQSSSVPFPRPSRAGDTKC